MKKMLIIVSLLCWLSLGSCREETKLNVFLTDEETWLLFPHKQFYIYTYTTNCSLQQPSAAVEHRQFKQINAIKANNSCHQLDVLRTSDYNTDEKFYYAKLAEDGLCTVYRIHQDSALPFYQYPTLKNSANLLMMNELNVFVWNAKSFIKIEYCLFSLKVNVIEKDFPTQDERQCSLNNDHSVLCWKQSEILVLDFLLSNFKMTAFGYDSDPIVQILPLSSQDQAFLVCSSSTCDVCLFREGGITVYDSLDLIEDIMGGAIHQQSNTLVIALSESALLFSFNFYEQIELKLIETINYPSQFQCARYERSLLLRDMISIQCLNLSGERKKLLLLKDALSNYYYAYNPIDRQDSANTWIAASLNKLLVFYEDEIQVRHKNFYFLSFSNPQTLSGEKPLEVVCVRSDSLNNRQESYYKITVVGAAQGEAYIDETIETNQEIVYKELIRLQLRSYFKASDILSYRLSSNCSFIEPVTYRPMSYSQFFSLYNRQKCVQTIAGGGKLFYRLLQINETFFYVEQCLPLNFGFGCQLIDIYDRVQSLRMVYKQQLIAFYIHNEKLILRKGKTDFTIFTEAVYAFQLINLVLRVQAENGHFFGFISQIVEFQAKWVKETEQNMYFHEGSSVIQLTPDSSLWTHGPSGSSRLIGERDLGRLLSREQSRDSIEVHSLVKQGDFLFIIYGKSMTKVYVRDDPIVLYSIQLKTNRDIANVRITDLYLTISYLPNGFEIYDITDQAVAARVASSLDETIMTDIIVMDSQTILIPIQSTTNLILIERNLVASVGSFTPMYDLFHEHCKFRIDLHKLNQNQQQQSDLNAPEEWGNSSSTYQEFTLAVKYFIDEIDLDTIVEVRKYPEQCHNCLLSLRQSDYLGPIFSYELNDDYYQHFLLVPHLTIEQCVPGAQKSLHGLLQVRFEGDYLNNEILMMDGEHLYLMNSSLSVISSFTMNNTKFCSSYFKFNEKYLILCDRYFLLVDGNETRAAFRHDLDISYETRNDFQLQFHQADSNLFYLIVLDHDIKAHIFELCLESRSIQRLDNYSFNKIIDDLKIINNMVIILKYQYLCIWNASLLPNALADSAVQKCFYLADHIPHNYASSLDYDAFIPYFSDGTLVRALILAKSVEDLHLDIEIDLSTPYKFTILNAYAGYECFKLKELLSLNKTEDSYSYFVLLYESIDTPDQMIAYYKYNQRYAVDGIIGQIRSAELLDDYFTKPLTLSFATFPNQMYIAQANRTSPPSELSKKKQCVSVNVKDELSILLNYKEAPPIKFLILQARNLNQMTNHFIRLHFVPSTDNLWKVVVGVAVVVLLLVGVVVSTNRCKNSDFDVEPDMVYYEVDSPNRLSDEEESTRARDASWPETQEERVLVRDSTSLLHSKQSEYVPPGQYSQSQREQIIIIGGD